ncbi:MAG: polyprenyl synthetase family protein [Spirochaetes bacterium]|nr:polyprenyl synthetase family protein [Spirochaetota bacterium]
MTAKNSIRQNAYALVSRHIGGDRVRVQRMISAQFGGYRGLPRHAGDYFFSKNGKMIRASLALLLAKECGAINQRVCRFAAAVELIHAASLIHDDIIDGEALRRGRATLNKKWNNKVALLFGDLVFVKAFGLFNSLEHQKINKKLLAAVDEMCVAQLVESERRFDLSMTPDAYLGIAGGKTAALFELCGFGALALSDADAAAGASVGRSIGMAFQLLDDADDIGANDLTEGYFTYPLLHTLRHCGAADKRALRKRLRPGITADERDEVKNIIVRTGGLTAGNERAAGYLDKAQSELKRAGLASTALFSLIDELRARSGV